MLKGFLVGNLGSDAEVKNENGQQFVAFKVADSRRWKDASNNEHEETTWVSCTMNGDGGKILPFLKKGTKVVVVGRQSFNVYSSKVDRCMKAGVKMFVESIELVGGQVDPMPRQLVDIDGLLVNVCRAYYIPIDVQENKKYTQLMDAKGNQYAIAPEGWITPITQEESQDKKIF